MMHSVTGGKVSKSEPIKTEILEKAYFEAYRARKIDDKSIVLYKQNKCHFQIGCAGHEIIQVAAALNFNVQRDWFYPYYRDMAFVGALGMSSKEFFLNILNKPNDPNSGGRHMPMHYGHKGLNIVSQSSPTGTQFLQAVGAAKALKFRGQKGVVYVSSGEGTTAQGSYYEALNWAGREHLPIIFLIQNNNYAISVPLSEQIAGTVSQIAGGFEGFRTYDLNGLDFNAAYEACNEAVNRALNDQGPSVIDAHVVRLQSHSISDNQLKYRLATEVEAEKDLDPLIALRKLIGASKASLIESNVIQEVEAACDWALEQADIDPKTVELFVLKNSTASYFKEEVPNTDEEVFFVDAINLALDEELTLNPEMVIFGQDVAGGKGGVFTATIGLTKKHGAKRVFNSPLAEASIIGTAIGMATLGMKPVVEIQFADYCWTAMMDLRNELSMMLYRSNGNFSCPAVVRIPVGGFIRGGIYHSQNIEATFAHFPGLKIIYPSNAFDAKGLLKAAIRDDDPVLFLEHKGLYRQVYAKGKKGGAENLVSIGVAKIVREGSDCTIVTWGAMVQKSLQAIDLIYKEYASKGQKIPSIEVIDLRTIFPLDYEAISKSVKKTSRILIVHEDVLFMGFGAEIAAKIAEQNFRDLDAPVMRVGGIFTLIPHSPILEDAALPNSTKVFQALKQLLEF